MLADEPYRPAGGRLALADDEGGEYDAAKGTTMRELLRVRRRRSRFGGTDRPKYTPPAAAPHMSRGMFDSGVAGRGSSEAPWSDAVATSHAAETSHAGGHTSLDASPHTPPHAPPHAPGAVNRAEERRDDEALMDEFARRVKRAPGEKRQTPFGTYATVHGTWPHDEFGTRPDAGEQGALLAVDGDDAPLSSVGATVDDSPAAPAVIAQRLHGTRGENTAAAARPQPLRAPRDDGEGLRFRGETRASAARARGRTPPPGYANQPDANLEPIEREPCSRISSCRILRPAAILYPSHPPRLHRTPHARCRGYRAAARPVTAPHAAGAQRIVRPAPLPPDRR